MEGVVYDVPDVNNVPFVRTGYQLMVAPAEAVAPKVTVPDPVTEPGVVSVMVGLVLTVSVAAPEVTLALFVSVITTS